MSWSSVGDGDVVKVLLVTTGWVLWTRLGGDVVVKVPLAINGWMSWVDW